MWQNLIHPAFLRGLVGGVGLAIVARWIVMRVIGYRLGRSLQRMIDQHKGAATIGGGELGRNLQRIVDQHRKGAPTVPDAFVDTMADRELGRERRRILAAWIGCSLRCSRSLDGELEARAVQDIRAELEELRRRTWLVVQPDDVDPSLGQPRPPGPPVSGAA
jgi:hypothetical protein